MRRCVLLVLLFLTLNPSAARGEDVAIDFTVTDIHGNEHSLFNYLDQGKYVLLEFTTPMG